MRTENGRQQALKFNLQRRQEGQEPAAEHRAEARRHDRRALRRGSFQVGRPHRSCAAHRRRCARSRCLAADAPPSRSPPQSQALPRPVWRRTASLARAARSLDLDAFGVLGGWDNHRGRLPLRAGPRLTDASDRVGLRGRSAAARRRWSTRGLAASELESATGRVSSAIFPIHEDPWYPSSAAAIPGGRVGFTPDAANAASTLVELVASWATDYRVGNMSRRARGWLRTSLGVRRHTGFDNSLGARLIRVNSSHRSLVTTVHAGARRSTGVLSTIGLRLLPRHRR